MRILYINHYAGSFDYGMEFRPLYLSREWVRLGHEVLIVAASESHVRSKQPNMDGNRELEETIDGVRFLWLKTPRYDGNGIGRIWNIFCFLLGVWRKSGVLAEQFRPDVVIASSTYPMDIVPAERVAKKAGAKMVFEVHDLWPLSPIELGGMSPRHPFIRLVQWAEDRAYRLSDIVISMLPKAKEYMCSRGMAPEKFFYVPNGIDLQAWDQDQMPVPGTMENEIFRLKNAGKFLVGYLGAHGLANGLDVFLESADLLQRRDRAKRFQLVLVGSGPEKKRLQNRAREMGLENLTFFDSVSKRTVPSAIRMMDAVYIGLQKKSLFRYGISPNKLIDYMAAGVPVLNAVEAGNNPVEDARCGLSIPAQNPIALADAIEKISSFSRDEIAQMSARARRYVETNHDYRILAKAFLERISENPISGKG
ncbi:MAG: glycosyltransferase family 4 protein [Bdellovibrionaceae bacterium]|nr:glycosyltransferase family 4 protein [Pseudobdellovibrionaceae bacterium]